MNPRYRFHRQLGVGLVEIMVAITLSLILTAGLVQVYTGNKQTYRIQEALSRVQENGRFALDFITRDLRSAGFLGCAGTLTKKIYTVTSGFEWDFEQIIVGDPAPATAGLVSPSVSPSPGRDVLTIRRSLGNPVQVVAHGGGPAGSAPITVAPGHDLQPADVVMVTDCTDAAIFQITNDPSLDDTVQHTGALGKDYTTAGAIVKLMTSTYYVGNVVVPGRPTPTPTLFRKDGTAVAQELVEGVEDMQVLYGIDPDGDRTPNRYVTADTITDPTDWGDVVSAEVRLLLQTLDNNLAPQAQAYTFNGIIYDGAATAGHGPLPTDLRLRRVFTNTISIRNRTL